MTFRLNGRIYYLGDNEATDEACAAYRAKGYTDIPVGMQLGVEPVDFFDEPDKFRERLRGFNARGIRAIPIIGFEGTRDFWTKHKPNFKETLRRFVSTIEPEVSCYLLGIEVNEYWTWDETLDWIGVIALISQKPIAVHMGETLWGPQSDVPWSGGKQMAWWKEARKRAPNNPLAMAFQHRNYSYSESRRPNRGFLSPPWDMAGMEHDKESHTAMLLEPHRLPSLGVSFISFEYAFNGTDDDAQIVSEAEAASRGDLALGAGAIGAINGCTP